LFRYAFHGIDRTRECAASIHPENHFVPRYKGMTRNRDLSRKLAPTQRIS
jgi:hypothetical protein